MGDNGFNNFMKKDSSPLRQFVEEILLPVFAPSDRQLAEQHLGKPIVTSHVYPPIPCRKTDWCAYPDGEEEEARYGWGATEAEAISDLIMILRDEDERIPAMPEGARSTQCPYCLHTYGTHDAACPSKR